MENEEDLTRIKLLAGKKELSEEELAEIIDTHHEYADISSLKKYTEKKFRNLSKDEKEKLVKNLLADEPYIKYKNCWIAKSKLLYDTSETLAKETGALSRLSDLGYEVYLLPYAYARDNMNCCQKSADSITESDFLEMKSVISVGKNAGYDSYKDARHQASNIYISFVNEIDEQKGLNNIYRAIGGIKKMKKTSNQKTDFSGYLFLNFEKTGKTNLYEISKSGNLKKIENPNVHYLKKYKGVAGNSQVEADPITEYGSLPNIKETPRANFQALEKTMIGHSNSLARTLPHFREKSNNPTGEDAQQLHQIQNIEFVKKTERYEKILYQHTKVNVNGVVRECKNGLVNGFKNAVSRVDELRIENSRLRKENENLKSIIQTNLETEIER